MAPLLILISTLSFGILFINMIPRTEKQGIQIISLLLSICIFLMSLEFLYWFNPQEVGYQFRFEVPIIPEYDLYLSFGLDSFGLSFLLLTTFIMPLCIYAAEPIENNYKQLIIYLLLIELCIILTFASTNALFFYVFFESVLIPMYFLIGLWGSRERKINAAYYIVLYTIFGSFFLLFGILYLYNKTGSLDMGVLLHKVLSKEDQIFLFIFFFLPFAIKIPMFPLHIWLPEAHVEAPTIGSVILASLLLKLGGYGFIRFTISIVPAGCDHYKGTIYFLAVLGMLYAAIATMRQNDLKRIIAYSSIAHMNLAVIGIFSFTQQGIAGAMYLMLSHGIVSAALFFCVGVLSDRYHTRALKNYSGLSLVMPLFCTFFLLFTCANMSFPITANFIGEFLIFVGAFDKNTFIMLFSATSTFLSAAYSIWCYNRMCSGTSKIETESISEYADLNRREFIILLVLLIGMIIFGVYSSGITDFTDTAIQNILVTLPAKR